MLRTGLELFALTPRREQTTQMVCLCFDRMLGRANDLVNLDISDPFHSWMFLSLLRLAPTRWSEHLKDMGHRFPREAQEHRALQQSIVRESTLAEQTGALGRVGPRGPSGPSHIFIGDASEPITLFLCLGQPVSVGPSAPTVQPQYLTGIWSMAAAMVTLWFISLTR